MKKKVIVKNLENGEERLYPSVTECSADIGVSDNTIASHVASGKPYKGYTFRYKGGNGLVPLRLNKNTIIMVSEEECNEMFAEYYRQKLHLL